MRYVPRRRIVELESKDYTPNDSPTSDDLYAHAPGRICEKCQRPIDADQIARRHGESGWVHDLCPKVADRPE